ncbi:HAMP domain-containing protein [Nonomuraea ferruginea]
MVVLVAVPLASIDAAVPMGSARRDHRERVRDRPAPPPRGSAVALVVLIPVALALGWFVAGRFLRPLRAIAATAQSLSAGNLHRRLGLGEPADELTELGHILDGLFARLQSSFDAQRHFVANASHELRTPSRACAPSSKSPWPTPTPTPAACARPARRPSLWADTRSGSSRHCSIWPPASAA